MRLFTNQDGYTLLELLMVISILTMSYMLLTPIIVGKTGSAELNSATEQIVGDLRLLRSTAIMRGVVARFKITEDGTGYEISVNSNPVDLNDGITLSSVAENAYGNEVHFFPDGSNSGIHLRLTVGDKARDIISTWPSGKMEVRDVV